MMPVPCYVPAGETKMVITGLEEEREHALEMIEAHVDAIVEAVCKRHYEAPTQEHQLSAKLAEAIESELAGFKTRPFTMGVSVQDFPDNGRGS
jgi:hypothetical protein